jgi:hypothetical protein
VPTRRIVVLAALALLLVSAVFLVSVPKFANTREKAQRAAMRVAQEQAPSPYARAGRDQAAAAAPAVTPSAAAVIRLPTVGELMAQVPADTARLLIRTGEMSIEVDSLEPAVEQVRVIVRRVGGFIANTSTVTNESRRGATLEVKVPATRFDQAVELLRPVGKVEAVNVTVEDVGEEYVDVAARMANAQRLEARLLNLLATRAGRLDDVLQVERELARVREEIERYAGRLQFLRQHAALSTLTVQLYEPGTVVGSQPGAGVIGDAFLQAWRNFIWLIAFLVQALGVVLPLGALAAGGWWVWQRVRGATS